METFLLFARLKLSLKSLVIITVVASYHNRLVLINNFAAISVMTKIFLLTKASYWTRNYLVENECIGNYIDPVSW